MFQRFNVELFARDRPANRADATNIIFVHLHCSADGIEAWPAPFLIMLQSKQNFTCKVKFWLEFEPAHLPIVRMLCAAGKSGQQLSEIHNHARAFRFRQPKLTVVHQAHQFIAVFHAEQHVGEVLADIIRNRGNDVLQFGFQVHTQAGRVVSFEPTP